MNGEAWLRILFGVVEVNSLTPAPRVSSILGLDATGAIVFQVNR